MMYHNALSPVVVSQVLTALRIIMGKDGTDIGARKLKSLRDNSNFVRRWVVLLSCSHAHRLLQLKQRCAAPVAKEYVQAAIAKTCKSGTASHCMPFVTCCLVSPCDSQPERFQEKQMLACASASID